MFARQLIVKRRDSQRLGYRLTVGEPELEPPHEIPQGQRERLPASDREREVAQRSKTEVSIR
jgi:hypothetical protein